MRTHADSKQRFEVPHAWKTESLCLALAWSVLEAGVMEKLRARRVLDHEKLHELHSGGQILFQMH